MASTRKTSLRMNMRRYVETQLDGDVLSELVKNGLEAKGATHVIVTLDRENRCLTVTNDGEPVQSEDELDSLFLEIGTTGKDERINFGKGFSAVFTEGETRLVSGNYSMVARAWDDIEISAADTPFDGTSVVVFLKEDSEILGKENAEHRVFLKSFLTDKAISFNGSDLQLAPFVRDDYDEIAPGLLVQFGGHYQGFMLADGSVAPVRYRGFTASCGIIIADIAYVNTERNSLKWTTDNLIDKWYKQAVHDRFKDSAQDISNFHDFIRHAEAFFDDILEKLGSQPISYGPISTIEEVIMLGKWAEHFEGIAERLDIMPLPDKVDHYVTDDQREYCKTISNPRSYEVHAFGHVLFRDAPATVWHDVVIGVYVENGEPLGKATIEDAIDMANSRIIGIEEAFTKNTELLNPFVAVFVDDSFLEVINRDWINIDVEDELDDMGMRGKAESPPPDFRHFIRPEASPDTVSLLEAIADGNTQQVVRKFQMMARDLIVDKERHSARHSDDEDAEYLWTLHDMDGIPVLVHKSVKDLSSVRFTPRIQRRKWAVLYAVTKLVMDYSDGFFGKEVVPALFISRSKYHKNAYGLQHGEYIAINAHGTKIPKSKRKAGLVMFVYVLHELCHFHRKRHDRSFMDLFTDVLIRLLTHDTFLSDLFKAVIA